MPSRRRLHWSTPPQRCHLVATRCRAPMRLEPSWGPQTGWRIQAAGQPRLEGRHVKRAIDASASPFWTPSRRPGRPETRRRQNGRCGIDESLVAYIYLRYQSAKSYSLHYSPMPRPRLKTAATSLKMTPEVRELWELCAVAESRSLTNMFEVMVREYAKRLGIAGPPQAERKKSARKP